MEKDKIIPLLKKFSSKEEVVQIVEATDLFKCFLIYRTNFLILEERFGK